MVVRVQIESFLQKVRRAFKLAFDLSPIPSRLPIGMAAFDTWADSIVDAYGLPSNDSVRFGIATAILHLESNSKVELNFLLFKVLIPTSSFKSKAYFGHIMLKGAANQVAGGVMQELKQKQAAAAAQAVVEQTK